jgi:hypothetical protein
MMSYIDELQAWANERVAEYEANKETNQGNWHWPTSPSTIKFEMLNTFKSKTSSAVYTVFDYNGRIKCNCPGFSFRNKCRHITEATG